MTVGRSPILLAVLVLAMGRPAETADSRNGPPWRVAGPRGGEAWNLSLAAECPDLILFVEGSGGVVKSADRGGSWTNADLSRGVLGQDPWDPKTFYVGAFDGVDVTHDGGATFVPFATDYPAAFAAAIATDPMDRNVLYAVLQAPGCYVTCPPPNAGVFKSGDRGEHWALTTHPRAGASQIILEPWDSSFVYTSTSRSADGGRTWSALGLPSPNPAALALGRSFPATIYAANDAGLFVTDDHGVTWRPAGITGPVSAVAVSVFDPDRIVAGLPDAGAVRSVDGGVAWTATDWSDGDLENVRFDPCDGDRVYAVGKDAGQHNVFTSDDGGTSWTRRAVFDAVVDSLALDPADPQHLFALQAAGSIFESGDGGAHWSAARPAGAPDTTSSRHAVVDPARPGRLFAWSTWSGSLYRTDDSGRTWSTLTLPDPYPEILSVVAGGDRVLASTATGIFSSSDGGDTWNERAAEDFVLALTPVVGDPEILFATQAVPTEDGDVNRVLRSRDGGSTWAAVYTSANGLTVAVGPGELFVAAANGSGGTGVYRSEDGGDTWRGPGALPGFTAAFAADPVRRGTLYAVQSSCPACVSKSDDGGESWHPFVDGVACTITDLGVSRDGSTLHAASECGEIDIDLEPSTITSPRRPTAPVVVGPRR